MSSYDPAKTAILLIGYQRDWFDSDGVFNSVIEESSRLGGTVKNTVALLNAAADTEMTVISAPIAFSEFYNELENPIGILKMIKDAEAFKLGTPGAETIDAIAKFGDWVVEVPGRIGFNAFSNTDLAKVLSEKGIETVVVCGAVTSLCVNATGMKASEDYKVVVLSDCVSGRTQVEQDLFCNELFPYFAEVMDHSSFIQKVSVQV
ncbi:MAG: cysteine hydrolase [Planctomycetota bacterium]|nr:cysteine hydrolase [Planctomycetota bacterium]